MKRNGVFFLLGLLAVALGAMATEYPIIYKVPEVGAYGISAKRAINKSLISLSSSIVNASSGTNIALASNKVFIGRGDGVSEACTLSGIIVVRTGGYVYIINGGITNAHLADNAVTGGKILGGTIASNNLGTGVVDSVRIKDSTIASGDMGANSVLSAAIADNAVSNSEIAVYSVDFSQLVLGLATAAQQTVVITNCPEVPTNAQEAIILRDDQGRLGWTFWYRFNGQ